MVSKDKTFLSFFWVFIEKFGYSGITLISTLVLARLLTPYEFGLIGTVAIFVSVSDMIVEAGFGAALVQKKNITKEDYSTVFIFNAIMSVILYVILFFVAPLIAKFYDNSIYSPIIRILGLKLLINAFTLTQRVHILRELAFKKQAFINTLSLFLSVLLAIILAYMGYGVWALVAQLVSYSFFIALLMFIYVKFIPSLVFSTASFKELFSFGGKIIINSALRAIYNDAFGLIITKKFSTNLTGLYSQAKRLVAFPNSIFTSLYDTAGFPILSRIEREEKFKKELTKINRGVFSLALPLLLIIPFQAKNIVLIALGENWLEAASILSILSISLLTSLVDISSTAVLKAKGMGREILRYGVLKITIGFIILLITMNISFYAIMYGIVVTNTIYSIIIFNLISRTTLYKWKDIYRDFLVVLIAVVFIYLFVSVVIKYLIINSIIIEFLVFSLFSLSLVILWFFLFRKSSFLSVKGAISK